MECQKCHNKTFKPLETDSAVCMICGTYVYKDVEVVMPVVFKRQQAHKEGAARGGKPKKSRGMHDLVEQCEEYMQKVYEDVQKWLSEGIGYSSINNLLPRQRRVLKDPRAIEKYYRKELARRRAA